MTGTSRKSATAAPTTITGFTDAAFQFLHSLSENQTRDWFLSHKADYETNVRAPMARLVTALSEELSGLGIPLQGDPKRSIFRINRDIRFSNDKRPYKTHISATLTRDSEKLSPGLLYIHVDPEGSFVAAGFHRPPPDVLRSIRNRIVSRPQDFRRMLLALAAESLSLSADEDALTRAPRGFERVQEPDLLDVIRRNSLIVRRTLTKKLLKDANLPKTLAGFAEAASPLLHFGWKATDS